MNEHGIFILLRAAWHAGVVANEHRIVIALLNALWQSSAIALFTVAALRFAPRMNANARCAVWMLAFFVVAALPAVDFAVAKSVSARPSQTVSTPLRPVEQSLPGADAVILVVADRPKGQTWAGASPTRRTPETAPVMDAGPDVVPPARGSALTLLVARLVDRFGTLLFWTWLLVAAALGVRLALQLNALHAAKRSVTRTDFTDEFLPPAREGRAYEIGVSDRVEVPCLLGLFRPVIAIPRPLLRRLSAADLTRVVLHESAHVRRYDDWFNFLEQAVLAVVFFNPVLHSIVRCTNLEREIACDDAVTARADRLRYAECLSALAAHARLGGAVMAPGLFEGRRQLLVRIEQLLDAKHCVSSTLGRIPYVAMSLTAMLAVLLCQVGIPVLAADRTHQNTPARVTALRVVPTKPHKTARSAITVASVRVVGNRQAPKPKPSSSGLPVAAHAPPPPKLAAPTPVVQAARVQISVITSASPTRVMPHPPSAYHLYSDNNPAIAFAQPRVSDVAPIAMAAVAAPARRSVLLIYPKNGDLNTPENAELQRYIKALKAAGYTVITTRDASMLLDHAVSVPYARAMHDAGLGLESAASALAKLRDHDVSADYARSMKELLRSQADWEALPRLRDHDVAANLARAMSQLSRAQALSQMDVRALAHLSDHGVSAEYLRAMARSRYRGKLPCPGLTADEISQLRDQDIDAAYVASLAAVGYADLSVPEIVRLRAHDVTADFIRRTRSAHHNALLSVDELIRLHDSANDGN